MSNHFIGVTQGMSGWFAVDYWLNPDMGGFIEPWQTGIGRYATRAEAEQEAADWAEAEQLPLRLNK